MCDNKEGCMGEIERLSNSVQRLRDENQRLTAEPERREAGAVPDNQAENFFCDLASKQEPLGPELRQALSENIEDLYEADEQAAPVAVPDGYTPVRTETLKWLLGERGDFEPPEWQRSEHERIYGRVGSYWWRTHLRDAMLNAAPPAPAVDEQDDYSDLVDAAKQASSMDFDSAELHTEGGYTDCPYCDGGLIEVEADFCNFDDLPLGVQFYGIGKEFGLAERYYRAATPARILALVEELSRLRAQQQGGE